MSVDGCGPVVAVVGSQILQSSVDVRISMSAMVRCDVGLMPVIGDVLVRARVCLMWRCALLKPKLPLPL